MLLDVKIMFDDALRSILPEATRNRAEMVRFLLEHERKPLAVNNLCAQILIAEKRTKLRMDQTKLKLLVFTSAKMFAQAAVNSKIQQMLSPAEKKRIESEKSQYDEIKSAVKGLDDDDEGQGS